MRAEQGGCCIVHRREIQLAADSHHLSAPEGVPYRWGIADEIPVCAGERRETRIKTRRSHAHVGQPDIIGQQSTQTSGKRVKTGVGGHIHVSDLTARMDPRISPTRTVDDRGRRQTQCNRKRLFDNSLHRALAGLDRPASKIRAVVGDVKS